MRYLLPAIAGLILNGCSYLQHHQDVRPNVSGTHRVVLNTEDRQSGYQKAKPQADHFCKSQSKVAFIVSENYRYTGSLSEADYHALKAAAKVVKKAGGASWLWGRDENSRESGEVAAVGGSIVEDAIGPGYVYTLDFQCQ
ncbi:hypothetical protein GZ77_14130 [Endozoicomonas montiporae]|uniref:Lipoprotein n=2 Tax=Endozoicomonas montiporae TaxID=1027273 RepID=A0A081N4X0_9GAMM|nr:hypothetical protein [Endozoicomonas montiporae]AMO57638.1 hypothetical protein EZMO1_3675 [Endozoicomonas montiporae CL-33]KEQ13493.1 hypothetical protein GZ77_14130 [Endozoicomonas montiporae]